MQQSSTTDGFSRVANLVRGYQVSKMIEVACSLELADRINSTALPVRELATECGANADMLLRLLRALAAFGLFEVSEDHLISHSEDSRWLRKDSVPTLHYAARYWAMPSTWTVWGVADHAIRTGEAPFEHEFQEPYFEYLQKRASEAAIFNAFMQNSPDDRHAAVVDAYDFSAARLVVDVGGGNGALLAAILVANPKLRGLLFDQPSVVSAAPAVLGNLSRRCAIEAGSFFDFVPKGGDIYTLSLILHDWDDARCVEILKLCRSAIREPGRLVVIERVLDTRPGETDPMDFLTDMHMMMLFPGARERTLSEFAALFRDAGFGEPTRIRTRSVHSILEARPV